MLENIWIVLLNMSMTASVVILMVCLIRLFLKRMPKIFSYVLWAVVLFRLLCPFSLESSFSFLNVMDGSAAAEQGRMEYISTDIGYQAQPQTEDPDNTTNETVSVTLPAKGLSDTANEAESSSLPTGTISDTGNETVSASFPAADAGDSASLIQIVLSVTAWIWLAGVLAMAAYQLVSLFRFRKGLQDAKCEEENIYCLPGGGTPFVYGLIRPRVYLPSGLGGEERRYMLLHEQIHIRRGDQIFRFLGCAALCLHWFNPLVWLAFYLSGKDMELSCDEAVLRRLGSGVKKEYSGSLLSLAAANGVNRGIGHIPIAFGENNVKSRIQNVLRYRRANPVVVFFAALICVVAVAALALNPRSEEAESKSEIDQSAVEEDTISGSGNTEEEDAAESAEDTYTIVMADESAAEAEVPDVVLSAALEWIAYEMEILRPAQQDAAYREMYGNYDFVDYRISCLELVCTYENLDGKDYEVWLVDFQFLVDEPDAILIFPGPMEIDSQGWLQATYPDSYYLIFEKTEDTIVFVTCMVFNEGGPSTGIGFNEIGFTSDLRKYS